jgi:UDP-N-acetylmuramate dehydrogenase
MKFLRNELLKKHTSFKVGGPADYFCVPQNSDQLKEAVLFAQQQRLAVAVMGAGSNLLVLDKGFRGLVIKLAGGINQIKFRGRSVYVGAGVSLGQLLKVAARRGLGGLEFLVGVPATVGGAAIMNAGAWGKEIGKYIERIKGLDYAGEEKIIEKKALKFGYRRSLLQKRKIIIFEVVLKLRKSRPGLIRKKLKSLWEKRKATQPLGIPSAGSVFKNPKGDFAGKLLEEAGCKGMRVGDAQVCPKHANFIVNLADSKAADIIRLMTLMQKKIKVKLEPEIKIMLKSSP